MADRLSKLEQQQKELAEKIKQEKAKLRREEQERERKRKRIVGDLVLAHYHENAQVRAWVDALIAREVTANAERALFGLQPRREEQQTPKALETGKSGQGAQQPALAQPASGERQEDNPQRAP
jgi:hypothetical protein